MSEWQDIASAPESLDYILVTDGKQVWPSYISNGGCEIIEMGDRGGGQYEGITHWMLLPAPPLNRS